MKIKTGEEEFQKKTDKITYNILDVSDCSENEKYEEH